MAKRRTQSSEAWKVSLPTPSNTAATPCGTIFLHGRDEIGLAIEHRVIAGVLAHERGFFLRPDGADHGRAEMSRPLAEREADAARDAVDQDRVASPSAGTAG